MRTATRGVYRAGVDWDEFARIGAERKQLVIDLAKVEAKLTADMPAQRAAGHTIAEIMAATGGADSWVRKYAPKPKRATAPAQAADTADV